MKCYASKTDGDCPVCGMHLEKKDLTVEVSGEKLTCICPQEWDPTTAPKSCPMCGMMLQKSITVTLPTGEKKQKFVYMCPMACMTSDKPGECPECKRQMGRWEVKEGLGIKVKKFNSGNVAFMPAPCTSKSLLTNLLIVQSVGCILRKPPRY